MNLTDIIIACIVISALFRGYELGLTRQLLSTAGFVSGLLIGVLLQPYTTALVSTQSARAAVALLTTLGCASLFLGFGEYAAIRLKYRIQNHTLNNFDGWFGSIIGASTVLLAVWLAAAIVMTMPLPTVQAQARGSTIISRLNAWLPPATHVVSSLGHLISPNGFPQVFTGKEPNLPSSTIVPGISPDLQNAINRDETSVVKFEGSGCGGIVEGSGFVIADDLVATNAHVIAGVSKPYVKDSSGQHSAQPVWFDPQLDFAIVRVQNLAGNPLLISSAPTAAGQQGAVLGYPGGGPLMAGGAEIIDHFRARGRDIYNQTLSSRDIFSIAAKVIPGNSGGPLIASDGSVIGVVFAQSTVYDTVGYALSMPQLDSAISQAQAQNRAVSTGQCAE